MAKREGQTLCAAIDMIQTREEAKALDIMGQRLLSIRVSAQQGGKTDQAVLRELVPVPGHLGGCVCAANSLRSRSSSASLTCSRSASSFRT